MLTLSQREIDRTSELRQVRGRLIKLMQLQGISTLEDASRYLEEVYIDYWNDHFAVEPAESRNAHRKLPKKANLEALFAKTVTRSVVWTVPYHGTKGR